MFKKNNRRYFAVKVTDYKKLVDLCKKLKIKKHSLMDDYLSDVKTGEPVAWFITLTCSDKKYEIIKETFGLNGGTLEVHEEK